MITASQKEPSAFDRFVAEQRAAAIASGGWPTIDAANRWLAHWTDRPAADRLPPRLREEARHAAERPGHAPTGAAVYVPFTVSATPIPSLTLRANDGLSFSHFYDKMGLMAHAFGDPFPHFAVTFPNIVALVWGPRLRPICDAIRHRVCDVITAYWSDRFAPLVEVSKPFIDEIELKVIHPDERQTPPPTA